MTKKSIFKSGLVLSFLFYSFSSFASEVWVKTDLTASTLANDGYKLISTTSMGGSDVLFFQKEKDIYKCLIVYTRDQNGNIKFDSQGCSKLK